MAKGRKEMKDQEESLMRAQRIVESTIEVGTKTAETLHQQGEQMERVLDALDEIKFSMKKANQVIRDITRSLATDKCAPFLRNTHTAETALPYLAGLLLSLSAALEKKPPMQSYCQ